MSFQSIDRTAMVSLTKLEDLSDELLMMVIRHCGEVYSTFRIFFPLNRRFQRILLDPRSHLLTDYFFIRDREERLNFYSKLSLVDSLREKFRRISDENQDAIFEEFFQQLISIYCEEKARQIQEQYRIDQREFQEKRSQLSDGEKRSHDEELAKLFSTLNAAPSDPFQPGPMIQLVREKGASLQCGDYELGGWNMARAINERLLEYSASSSSTLRSLVDLFQILFISNPSLIRNRDYVGNGGAVTFYFLIHYLYQLKDFYSSAAPWAIVSVDRGKYQLIVNLFLFLAQCCQETPSLRQLWNDDALYDCLYSMSSLQYQKNEDKIFVQQCQLEVFRLLCRTIQITVDDLGQDPFLFRLRKIIRCDRTDLLHHIFFETDFIHRLLSHHGTGDVLRKFINLFTADRKQRKLFQDLFRRQSIPTWLAENDLIFILLEKREATLIKFLLKSVPSLIDRLDDRGNDPLLHLGLQVTGCRHRLVEVLLRHGANHRRVNIHQQDFSQVLQLSRNRKLLSRLIEHEIIRIDPSTETFVFPPASHDARNAC